MPIDFFELIKLIICIIIFIVPGYFWSYLILNKINKLERLVFGFIITSMIFIFLIFILDSLFKIKINQMLIWIIYIVYTIPIVILYIISIYRLEFKRPKFDKLKNPKIFLLILILIFASLMIFLPHLKENYYLPFHVDEWEHWSYSHALMESGSTSFINPYLGEGIISPLEIGFNVFTSSISWFLNIDFTTIFLFLPSLLIILVCLIAFNIGEKSDRKFGLESALFISFIPTTCRILGPSFFTPITLGMLFLIFLIWLFQQKEKQILIIIPFLIFCMFLIHPPTSLAGLILIIVFSLLLISEKKYKSSFLLLLFSLLPIGLIFITASRWDLSLQSVIDGFLGGNYILEMGLPKIWITLEQMGIILWGLCLIGVYYSIVNGKTIVRTIFLSIIAFIVLIISYERFGYGMPIMYERSFIYLFLMVSLMSGWGLSELVRNVSKIIEKKSILGNVKIPKIIRFLLPSILIIILISATIPAHISIPYYHIIDEKEFETYSWINENIESYNKKGYEYNKGVVDPYKASPFSAITGLNIISLSMSPLYGYEYHNEVEQFLKDNCKNTNFLQEFKASIISTLNCNNSNLTMIYPNVYIYSDLD